MGEIKDSNFDNQDSSEEPEDSKTPSEDEGKWIRRKDKIDFSSMSEEEFDSLMEDIAVEIDEGIEDYDDTEVEPAHPMVRIANSANLILDLDYSIRTGADLEQTFEEARRKIQGHEGEFVRHFDLIVADWLENLIQYKSDIESFRTVFKEDKEIAIKALFEKYDAEILFPTKSVTTVIEKYSVSIGLPDEEFDKYGLKTARGFQISGTPITFARANPLPEERTLIHENQHVVRDGLFSIGAVKLDRRVSRLNEYLHDEALNKEYYISTEVSLFAIALERRIKAEISAALSHSKRINYVANPEFLLKSLMGKVNESEIPNDDRSTYSSALVQIKIAREFIGKIDFDPDNPFHNTCKAYLVKIVDRLEGGIDTLIEQINNNEITAGNVDRFEACFMILPIKNIRMMGKLLEMVPNRTKEQNARLSRFENESVRNEIYDSEDFKQSIENALRKEETSTQEENPSSK